MKHPLKYLIILFSVLVTFKGHAQPERIYPTSVGNLDLVKLEGLINKNSDAKSPYEAKVNSVRPALGLYDMISHAAGLQKNYILRVNAGATELYATCELSLDSTWKIAYLMNCTSQWNFPFDPTGSFTFQELGL